MSINVECGIVTAHHGEMGVKSEEGVGTEFSVTLPLAAQAAAHVPAVAIG